MKGYSSSLPLFDKPPPVAVEPVDPNVLPSDVPRLKGAAMRVLERLKQGPATNRELERPECGGSRFGGRLRELRVAGVKWKGERAKGDDVPCATWVYTLIDCPVELS
jgi:hypothetical protein